MTYQLDSTTSLDDLREELKYGFGATCLSQTEDRLEYEGVVVLRVFIDPLQANRETFQVKKIGEEHAYSLAEFDPRFITPVGMVSTVAELIDLI